MANKLAKKVRSSKEEKAELVKEIILGDLYGELEQYEASIPEELEEDLEDSLYVLESAVEDGVDKALKQNVNPEFMVLKEMDKRLSFEWPTLKAALKEAKNLGAEHQEFAA